MSNNFNDILAEIKKVKTGLSVYVPSAGLDVQLKTLTLSQQKTIIESAVDSNLSVLFFNNTFAKILEDNLPDNLSKYDTIDRVNFALALRSKLKDIITIEDVNYNISDILAANKLITSKFTPTIVESANFRIYVSAPTIEYDNKINSILLRKYKDETSKSNKLKTLISDLYSYEIFKFIDKIEVKSSGNQLDLKSDIAQGIQVIESLDSSEFTGVIEQINKLRDIEKEYTRIPNTNTYIDIVPNFFVV
jgi:hypothetical protein